MKPGFALNFSPDGISLLHRGLDAWERVGDVALDDARLSERLGALRKTALGLEPQGLTTKLIIPNSQILYADIAAPGPDTASRRRQIRAALDGMTPYSVDELVFDWLPLDDGRVRVAVVARETLEEAEEFAADHRMAPVSFVAVPDADQFAGEAFFGATRLSSSLLPPGERVERDAEPVRLADGSPLGPLVVAAPAPVEEAATPEPEVGEPEASEDESPLEPTAVQGEAAEVGGGPVKQDAEDEDISEALRPGVAVADPGIVEPRIAEPESAAPESTEAEEPARKVVAEAKAAALVPEAEEAGAELEAGKRESVAKKSDGEGDAARPEPEIPAEVVAPEEVPEIAAAPIEEVVAEDAPRDSVEEFAPKPAFASRRAPVEAAAGMSAAPRLAAAPSRISLPGADTSRPAGQPALRADPGAPPRAKGARKGPVAAMPAPQPLRARVEITPRPPVEPTKPGLGLGAEALATPAEARTSSSRDTTEATEAEPTPPLAQPAASDPAAAGPGSGVFGSRTAAPVRGKPRNLGLILTVILLLFLGLVAVWASLFLGEPEPQSGSRPATEVTPPAAVQLGQGGEQDAAPPMPGPEELLLAEDAPFAAEPGEEIPADTFAGTVDLPQPGAADLSADTPTSVTAGPDSQAAIALQRPEVDAPAADPGVQRALPVLPSLNAIAVDAPPAAQIDPAPAEAVLAALAAAEAAAAAGETPSAPAELAVAEDPAQPTSSDVAAVEEEVFEVEVVEGRPAVVPPPSPFAEVEEAAVTPQLDVTDAVLEALAAELPEETPAEGSVNLIADPSLAGVRPRARPARPEAAATDPVAAEEQGAVDSATEEGEPAAPTLLAAAPRPLARPEALVAAAAPAEPEPVEEAAPADPASTLAVAASMRPAAKPSNFTAAVEQALSAALAAAPTPAPVAQQPARTAQPSPEVEEDNEPDIAASAVPNIPTRASVAAAATVTRGINLRQMNLISVAGTANNRRALVRMSNGRVVQVKVGDRLDGGQVAAIGERQLRYVKSGRTHVLDIPQG